jgi:hypothetical protein
MKDAEGRPVYFVGQPSLAPAGSLRVYARPDDESGDGVSWRQRLLDHNAGGGNQLGLFPAYMLYADDLYRRLADRFGPEKLYILSAGWGLIRADFLTPNYDITFSQTKPDKRYVRRRSSDRYDDFNMLPARVHEPLLLFASKAYLPLFCRLTEGRAGDRTVFYNADDLPEAPGCTLRRFENAKRDTNWQFDCANAYLESAI